MGETENKKKKTKKKLRPQALILLVLIAAVAVLAVFAQIKNKNGAQAAASPSASTTTIFSDTREAYELSDDEIAKIRQELSDDENINGDVQAVLVFPSGLIHQPVLQGTDNDHYLYTDWQTGDSLAYGSIMMDYQNNIHQDDMNTIIYGHYCYTGYYEDRTLAFTPLSQLLEKANYEANKYVVLVTDDNIRYYEIASVYGCPMVDVEGGQVAADDYQFNLVDYSEDYFNTYVNAIKQQEYYDTGVELTYGDHLLSLQTCIENHNELREIVVCKELKRVSF
ncbi:MAG: class B sortase [Galactobacillus timonensis]|uniref:class B sortase n=1 Tax=Galactobacillus timonensis TaxID=2041840 RepID=UPI002409B84B|nr:class B sortase [Galactobacillus timonensis]MDD6600480.1 class B sortase [Galactobacillus timonensis]